MMKLTCFPHLVAAAAAAACGDIEDPDVPWWRSHQPCTVTTSAGIQSVTPLCCARCDKVEDSGDKRPKRRREREREVHFTYCQYSSYYRSLVYWLPMVVTELPHRIRSCRVSIKWRHCPRQCVYRGEPLASSRPTDHDGVLYRIMVEWYIKVFVC